MTETHLDFYAIIQNFINLELLHLTMIQLTEVLRVHPNELGYPRIGFRSNRYELRRSKSICRTFAWWKVMEDNGRKPIFTVFEWVRVFLTLFFC